ncbi:MAG: hypothetical protein ABIG71_01860, partial [Candidatus Uhrbacteria bacterium]
LGLCTFAFALFTLCARRHVEFFVPLAVITIAIGMQPIIEWLWPPRIAVGWRRPGSVRRSFSTLLLGIIIFAFSLGAIGALSAQRAYYTDGLHDDTLRGIATWIKTNVEENEIIFHGDWGDFPPLFLWDRTHRYLVGMDPRFASFENPDRLRSWLETGRGEVPNGRIAQHITDTVGAHYAITRPTQEALMAALDKDPLAHVVYEDADGRVYELRTR